MKHKAVIVNDLFYKGCEPQWKRGRCGRYAPVRLYNQKEFEETGCDDIKIIANILENAGAVQCIPFHECPNSKPTSLLLTCLWAIMSKSTSENSPKQFTNLDTDFLKVTE